MKSLEQKFQKELKKEFIHFLPCVDTEGNDIYHCLCGGVNKNSPKNNSYIFDVEIQGGVLDGNIDFVDFSNAYKKTYVTCKKCKRDYSQPENFSKIQNINTDFLERYYINETKSHVSLYRIKGGSFGGENITFSSQTSFISLNKNSKEITVQLFNSKKTKVHLHNIVKNIQEFFEKNTQATLIEGFINIHDFIGKIAKCIVDAKNMNIIGELMNQMMGKSGLDILGKTITILLSIACYPNLSTIALTKNNNFLYDLITICPLPEKKVLVKNKATSPIKIFNLLVSLKNQDLQKELDVDDINKIGYSFKSQKGLEYNIFYQKDEIQNLNNDNLHREGAKVFVRDEIKDRTISNYIFNKIKNFDDYNKLIKWLKFITYENLIQLVMEYDIEFLHIAFSKIEFREDISFERIKQFLPMMLSYIDVALEARRIDSNLEKSPDDWYTYDIAKMFDFNLYDDCARMVYELNWNPNKVLNKIKDYKKLAEFHGNLIKHRSYVSSNEVNDRFVEFANKFEFLQNYSKNINVYFDINLISTPERLMNEAIEMHNCAGSYIRRVANGEYVAFIVYDNSPLRTKDENHKYMMVIEITYTGMEFVGIKSYCNKYGSDRFKEDVKRYLIDKDISFKEVPSIKTGIQSQEISYEGTFGTISKPENS